MDGRVGRPNRTNAEYGLILGIRKKAIKLDPCVPANRNETPFSQIKSCYPQLDSPRLERFPLSSVPVFVHPKYIFPGK